VRNRQVIRLTLFCLLGLLSVECLVGSEPKNLALSAQVSASPGAVGHGEFDDNPADASRFVNDGYLYTSLAFPSDHSHDAWIGLTWQQPITFREVLIRQVVYENLDQVSLQVRSGGQWRTVKTVVRGAKPLPKLILIRVEAQTTDAIRLTDFKGTPNFNEVEVYEGPTTPVMNFAGDAAGHIIGTLTDAFGASPLVRNPITLSGVAGERPWKDTTSTDDQGMFSVQAPVGLKGKIQATARVGTASVKQELDAGDLPLSLTVPNALESAVSLSGTWKFAPDPPQDFSRTDFDDSAWSPIDVPSHWRLNGFRSWDGVGGYRHHVQIPQAWRGRRVKIHFDGVYSGAEVWFNGQRVGWHEGGFTPFEVDVTDELHNQDNVLALRVTEQTRSSSLDTMSSYADFELAGIMRDVSIFPVPASHVERMQVSTRFDSDYRNATLSIDLTLVNESNRRVPRGEIGWELRSPEGVAVPASFPPLRFSLPPWGRFETKVEIPVERPQHWEAEHPHLYRLISHFKESGQEIEQVRRRVGFRQVDVRGRQLLINGVPVKLRGTCHHDSDPVRGRAVTPDLTRLDLQLMKEANLDALRTSHYPAIEALYDDADEMGVYVEAEAPFCWVDQADDLRLAPLIVQHTAELLERDRSHPSVIIWSLVNESAWGPDFDRSYEYVKGADPTRPVSAAESKNLDLATKHNPVTLARMQQYSWVKTPLIWDESLCVFQGIWGDGPELWMDPGDRDYWVAPLIPVWNAILHSEFVQGSMIWAWADDVFQVPGRGSEYGRNVTMAHSSDGLYGVPGKGLAGDAPWGVVDGWRRRKPEFWNAKKLYSPVKVLTLQVPTPEAGSALHIQVQNRYEFTNLSELTLAWQAGGESGELHANVAPGQTGDIVIPVRHAVSSGRHLHVRFLNASGGLVDEEQIFVGEEFKDAPPALGTDPLEVHEERILSGASFCVVGHGFEIAFDKSGAGIKRIVVGGQQVLYETPSLHILPADPSLPEVPSPWSWKSNGPIAVTHDGNDVVITAAGKYRDVDGKFVYRVTPAGGLEVNYDFTYRGATIHAREIGLRFGVPPWMDTLAWERRGEWTAYPPDHIGRNQGSAKAHSGLSPATPPANAYAEDDSPMGTNDFRSTKRNVLHASIRSRDGSGLYIASTGRQHLRASVESDRIALFVNDWFGGTASHADEWMQNYGTGREVKLHDRLQGVLRLHLLDGGVDGKVREE
jgi:beta-galactosidase